MLFEGEYTGEECLQLNSDTKPDAFEYLGWTLEERKAWAIATNLKLGLNAQKPIAYQDAARLEQSVIEQFAALGVSSIMMGAIIICFSATEAARFGSTENVKH
jgi:hypothetical protein